jgi:hypothetical protein
MFGKLHTEFDHIVACLQVVDGIFTDAIESSLACATTDDIGHNVVADKITATVSGVKPSAGIYLRHGGAT